MRHALRLLAPLALAALLSAAPAAAQSGGWSTPFEVSPPQAKSARPAANADGTPLPTAAPTPGPRGKQYGSSWFPNIAVGPDDSAHVIWYGGLASTVDVGESLDLLMYRELRNGAWSPANDVVAAGTGGYTIRNGIVMGRDGRLHVLMRNQTSVDHVSVPWDKAWSASAWSGLSSVSADGSYYTALGVDSKNVLHAFWSQSIIDDPDAPREECPNCANLFYRSSSDGGYTWSPPTNLSNSPDGDNRPQVKVDSRDRIHVVWDQGLDWYAGHGEPKRGMYRRSDDGGQSWQKPVEFTLPTGAVQQTTLAVTPDGNPIVVYRALSGEVYYQLSRDGGTTWAPAARVPGVVARDTLGDSLDQYTMESDSAGNVHLLMVGFPEGAGDVSQRPPALMHLTFSSGLWSSPDIVVWNDLYPEWPVLAVGAGNHLHAVWYTRSAEDRMQSERAAYRVWYSDRLVSAPQVAPLPTFTPEPTAQPTVVVVPTATATPTPLPASVAAAPPPDGPPRWEQTSLATIALALLPVGVVIGVLFAVRRLRR